MGEARSKPKYIQRKRKVCYFCANHLTVLDYKDLDFLRKYQSDRGKIQPRRVTGCCAKHQRVVAQALKRARMIGLVPFVKE